jgi:hypothetical protein
MYFDHIIAKTIYKAIRTNTGVFPPEVERAAIEYELSALGDTHRAWWGFMAQLSLHAEEISRLTLPE